MRESKEPIANLDMSSFIRYRRLQMPRMGNANAKKTRDQQRDIFERFFPSRPRESISSAEMPQSQDKDSTSLNSDDSGQGGLSSSEKDSLLDGMRTSTFSSCSEGNNSNSENESDFVLRHTRLRNRSRDDLDSICSEMRINDRTRNCLLQSHRGPRPHSTPPPRTNFVVNVGDEKVGTNCDPGHDHSKGTSKAVGSRSRKIGVGSKLTSGHKYRYKDKTNHQNHQTNSNSKLGVLDEDSQSNSDSALDTGSGSDAETVSRISISSDDGELVTIEKVSKVYQQGG